MKFSLIIPTVGRVKELERLFRSLAMQTFTDFEVIISDQNDDDRLVEVIRKAGLSHPVRHLRSKRGASRARNAGIEVARGEILTFPDDDCAYPPEVLERVERLMREKTDMAYLSGRSYFDDGADAIARHATEPAAINREGIHNLGVEFTLFIRRDCLGDLRFDEQMGVGAETIWHSDEGPDLMLRLEEKGGHGYYDPQIAIWHPRASARITPQVIDRSYRYACGNGYFLRKHGYPASFYRRRVARTLLGMVMSLAFLRFRRARFYAARARGLQRGWNSYGKPSS